MLCSNCHENEAVIFLHNPGTGQHQGLGQGYCLPCAIELELPGVQQVLDRMGVTDENVESLTEQMNQMVEAMGGQNPFEWLQNAMAQVDPEQMTKFMNLLQNPEAGSDDEGDEDEDDAPAAAETETPDLERDESDKSARWPKPRFPYIKPEEDTGKDKNADRPSAGDKQSVSEAIHMMFGPMLPGHGSQLQPAARGSDSEDREEDDGETVGTDRRASRSSGRRSRPRKRRFLDTYGTNLNRAALNGELDPLIGRERELDRVIQILNRRTKNNPVLLGEPGVGKTAIAHGLAQRIAAREVPYKLLPMEVYLIDMTGLVAGTQYRGQFESRMKGLVDEARQIGDIILVIDELHNIMGAGDAEGAMNAANILKPALAHGELRILGSTTLDEYRRFIERDSALERRFQRVIVDEPDAELSLAILRGLAPRYEKHHHVSYSDEVLRETVRLAGRYISDRFFPDKAIDIIDEAGSRVNLGDRSQQLLDEMRQESELLVIEQEQIQTALEQGPDDVSLYEKQANNRTRRLQLEQRLADHQAKTVPLPVTTADIAAVVELWTGIPLARISESESEKLLKLEERLHQRVVGQEQAVSALAHAIRRQRAGLGRRRKPASFIFVGPTGVGKTELVKALAEAIFGSEDAMIRLDMSEYMEAHTVSKLIGSPPGYVGYGDGGQLTEKVRRRPYSVLLLDEIEKAHPDVFNMLLQILDDGRLTDAQGRTVNFENTILVMTSNAGTTLKSHGIGFGSEGHIALENRVQTVLREIFRPEFLNRVDETIVFHELSRAEIRQIVDLMLREVSEPLAERGITLKLSDAAKDLLADRGYDPKFGARPLRKTIQRLIEDPLAEATLRGELDGKSLLAITVTEGELEGKGELAFEFV
ncbi:MAG: ATP-dependent Clp protease ATP-binding subunit [Bacillota bacterium]|nr:ATP-dependent Clp protease ATP-binding subunit [Bacillota bacterium]